MIANTIGAATAPGSSCTPRQDGSPVSGAAPGEAPGETSFSAAMASAAGASPAAQAPSSEASAAASAPGAKGAPAACSGGAASGPAPAPLAAKSAASDGAPAETTGDGPSNTAGAHTRAKGSQAGLAAPTGAKGETPKTASGDCEPKPAASGPGDASASSATTSPAAATSDVTLAAAAANPAACAPAAWAAPDVAQRAAVPLSTRSADERLVATASSATSPSVPPGSDRIEATRAPEVASADTGGANPTAGGSADSALPGGPPPLNSTLKAAALIADGNNSNLGGNLTGPTAGVGAGSSASVLAGIANVPANAGTATGFSPALVNIGTPVGQAGFGQDVSRQLVYLAKTGTQSAELSLQPASLGPVSVSIQMNGLQAAVVISASHAATRAALQDALPHLSALFQSSGLQLMGAHVGDGSQRNADPGAGRGDGMKVDDPLASAGATRATPIALAATLGAAGASNRLIDTFA